MRENSPPMVLCSWHEAHDETPLKMNQDVQFLSENAFDHVYDENDVDDDGYSSQPPLVYVPVEGYIEKITRKNRSLFSFYGYL